MTSDRFGFLFAKEERAKKSKSELPKTIALISQKPEKYKTYSLRNKLVRFCVDTIPTG